MQFPNLKKCLDNIILKYKTPGVDCIVYKNHEVLFRYYTGKSDLENNIAMNGNELYYIFSMTKMITCVCALQLLEQGKYKLNDPVYKYLPEFKQMRVSSIEKNEDNSIEIITGKTNGESIEKSGDSYAKNPITIWNLFTMTAGLDYDLKSKALQKALSENKKSTRELVYALSNTILEFEPGSRFKYSLCHDVLGALIEVWSNMSLGNYMKKNIFEPLGMNDTFFSNQLNDECLERMASRYVLNENKSVGRLPMECIYTLSENYESGGAGLISSTYDYALFLDALANNGIGKNGNKILSEETLKLMHTCQLKGVPLEEFSNLRPGYGYGLGVRTHIDKEKSGSLSPIGEFGWDGAAGALSIVDIKNNLSLTYFQHFHGWDIQIQSDIRNALYTDLMSE